MSFDRFAWSLDGFPGVLTDLATPLVRDAIESAVTKLIEKIVPATLDSAIAGGVGQPLTHALLGTTVSLALTPTAVTFDGDGESVGFDANLAVPPLAGFTPPPAAGSLVTNGTAPVLGSGPGLLVAINEDLLNRAGFEAWQSGLMNLRLDATTAAQYHLPASVVLDAGYVGTFLPELSGKLPDADPIAFVVTPRLPPVFTTQPAPQVLALGLGDLQVDLYDVVDTTNPTLVLSLDVAASATAGLELDAANHLRVVLGAAPVIDSSLVSSPLAPEIGALGVANLLDMSLPPLLDALAATWPGVALPVQGPVAPTNIAVASSGTFVIVSGDP